MPKPHIEHIQTGATPEGKVAVAFQYAGGREEVIVFELEQCRTFLDTLDQAYLMARMQRHRPSVFQDNVSLRDDVQMEIRDDE